MRRPRLLRKQAARCRWNRAESEFRAALQLSPDEPKALCGLGLALANAGREMEATDALVRGFRQEPSRVSTLHTLIRAAIAVGRYAEALEALKSYMQHERPGPELLFSCAVLSARVGERKEALRLLECVEQLQPAYPGIASYRAEWSTR